MWLSASCYFYRFTHVYSPVAFPKRFDPHGAYVRKWLPMFASFPAEYIYEPWRAPRAVQERHGVVVGSTYPARIVIHEEVSKVNVSRIAAAYRRAGPQLPALDDDAPESEDPASREAVGGSASSDRAAQTRSATSAVSKNSSAGQKRARA